MADGVGLIDVQIWDQYMQYIIHTLHHFIILKNMKFKQKKFGMQPPAAFRKFRFLKFREKKYLFVWLYLGKNRSH